MREIANVINSDASATLSFCCPFSPSYFPTLVVACGLLWVPAEGCHGKMSVPQFASITVDGNPFFF